MSRPVDAEDLAEDEGHGGRPHVHAETPGPQERVVMYKREAVPMRSQKDVENLQESRNGERHGPEVHLRHIRARKRPHDTTQADGTQDLDTGVQEHHKHDHSNVAGERRHEGIEDGMSRVAVLLKGGLDAVREPRTHVLG